MNTQTTHMQGVRKINGIHKGKVFLFTNYRTNSLPVSLSRPFPIVLVYVSVWMHAQFVTTILLAFFNVKPEKSRELFSYYYLSELIVLFSFLCRYSAKSWENESFYGFDIIFVNNAGKISSKICLFSLNLHFMLMGFYPTERERNESENICSMVSNSHIDSKVIRY